MKYRVIEKGNPMNLEAPKKLYGIVDNAGKFTIRDFAREIAGRSSLTRGDIENVLNNFLDELPTFLKLGLSVKLGDFGTMRLNIKSTGADKAVGFKASDITGVKVIFTPGTELKKSLANISFEEAK